MTTRQNSLSSHERRHINFVGACQVWYSARLAPWSTLWDCVIIGQKLNSTRFSRHGPAWRRFYESSYRRASWIKYLLRARLMYLSIYPLTSHNINWLGFPDIYKKSESHQHDISQIIVFHCRFHPIFTVETGVFESKIKPITTWRGYLILSLLV